MEINTILNNLSNEDWWVRKKAIEGLLSYQPEEYLPFLEEAMRNHEDALLRNASMDAYRVLGKRALSSLIRLLKDNDEEVRLFSTNLLGEIRDRRAVKELIEMLKDPDINVRIAATEALGKLKNPEAIDALTKSIEGDSWIALASIEALGEIGGKEAIRTLHHLIDREELRMFCINAIEKAGDIQSINKLSPFLSDPFLREYSLKAIVSIHEREGLRPSATYFKDMVPYLIEMLECWDETVKRAAFIALSWTEDSRAIPYLLNAINDEKLQDYAMNGLIAMGKPAVPAIIKALKNPMMDGRVILARILSILKEPEALIAFAEDEDEEVRVEVALALGSLRTKEAVNVLSRLLCDDSDEVSRSALVSLKNQSREHIREAMKPVLLHSDNPRHIIYALETLVHHGDGGASERLIKMAESHDTEIKKMAIEAIGRIKIPQALKQLCLCLDDKETSIRKEALRAIINIKNKDAKNLAFRYINSEEHDMLPIALNAVEEGDDGILPTLYKILKTDNKIIKLKTIEATGRIKNPDAIKQLTSQWSNDEDINVYIIEALRSIGEIECIPFILRGLRSEGWRVRMAASKALDEILKNVNKDIIDMTTSSIKEVLSKEQDPLVKNEIERILKKYEKESALL